MLIHLLKGIYTVDSYVIDISQWNDVLGNGFIKYSIASPIIKPCPINSRGITTTNNNKASVKAYIQDNKEWDSDKYSSVGFIWSENRTWNS